jgi:biopolymer transport protein ExbD
MIIPAHYKGLEALVPQPSSQPPAQPDEVVVLQVLADGSLRINQQAVAWEMLGSRLEEIFKMRASRTAFIRGDAPLEFGVVAESSTSCTPQELRQSAC